jgi:hypothetical protein
MSTTAPPATVPAAPSASAAPLGAALAAAAPASATAVPAPAAVPGPGHCDNCAAPLTGRFCAACGQRVEPPVHSLWHFVMVATEDLTHADSRLWRTLVALLFKPGYLTREFLHGRRASYLPPVRLYLVLSVLFFLYAALGHSQLRAVEISTNDHGAPKSVHVTPLKDAFGTGKSGETAEQRNQRECAMIDYEGPWQARLVPAIRDACLRIRADNGRSLQEGYLHNLPRAMFVFLPLLAGMMMLMYWWPRHYYVEHLLLLVHNHAFMFLLVMLGWALTALMPFAAGWVTFAMTLYIPWYVFRSMRVVYAQSRGLTLAKLALLSFFYLVSGALMLALTFVLSALTL